jgi:hypothetical protein
MTVACLITPDELLDETELLVTASRHYRCQLLVVFSIVIVQSFVTVLRYPSVCQSGSKCRRSSHVCHHGPRTADIARCIAGGRRAATASQTSHRRPAEQCSHHDTLLSHSAASFCRMLEPVMGCERCRQSCGVDIYRRMCQYCLASVLAEDTAKLTTGMGGDYGGGTGGTIPSKVRGGRIKCLISPQYFHGAKDDF